MKMWDRIMLFLSFAIPFWLVMSLIKEWSTTAHHTQRVWCGQRFYQVPFLRPGCSERQTI
jgi:hypothetical protein